MRQRPRKATTVASSPVQDPVIQRAKTVRNTPSTTRSCRVRGPIFDSSVFARYAASGVSRISGFVRRKTR